MGLCPFHEPSLVASRKNLWHCLGACAAGGSVIDWVMRSEGVSFRHAVELLRDGRAGADVTSGSAPQRSTVRKLPSPLDRSAEDAELLAQVVAFYHQTLTESPDALAYLQSRRVDHAEALGHFQLGFANRTLGYRLPNKQRREGAEVRGPPATRGCPPPPGRRGHARAACHQDRRAAPVSHPETPARRSPAGRCGAAGRTHSKNDKVWRSAGLGLGCRPGVPGRDAGGRASRSETGPVKHGWRAQWRR